MVLIHQYYAVRKFLKFCYFISVLFFFSCGNGAKNENNKEDIIATESEEVSTSTTDTDKIILCFGDSITAGFGLDDTNNAYPALLQSKIDSLGLDYTVINSGLSGETSAGGRSRVNWVLNQEVDIFLLELGANDGLRGVPLSETRANLQAIIDMVRERNPSTKIILAGMQLPPNMGEAYTTEFKDIFSELAEKNNTDYIPFILEDVGGIAELNQGDGIHPNIEGHKIVAENVWTILKPML
ncbi:arylesterase [Winogradskyella sp. A3E31]|uniref:arylesterase n=1 Tax=Winogradskyella sp. A3E31 TaxID=3349637 RepID=UPI00398AF990